MSKIYKKKKLKFFKWIINSNKNKLLKTKFVGLQWQGAHSNDVLRNTGFEIPKRNNVWPVCISLLWVGLVVHHY